MDVTWLIFWFGFQGHPHQFRHTFAKRMLLKGVSVLSVSKLLGHSSYKITESTYSRWIAERQRARAPWMPRYALPGDGLLLVTRTT